MSPKQAIKVLERKKRKLRENVVKVMEKYGEKGVETAQHYSSGVLSSVLLAKMGHPYGRRSGLSPVNPEVINRQSGTFFRSWKWRIVNRGSRLSLQVINDAAYARALDEGTKRTIARPIRQAIIKKLARPYRRAMQSAVRRACKA